jgi:hypothetical protein
MAANARDFIDVTMSINQMAALLKDYSFSSTLNLELKSENLTATGVWYRFHHGVTFTSWGEKITVTLTPIAPNAVRVDVHSECGMPTQVIDWGKNKQNISAIFNYIRSNSARYAQINAPSQTPAPVQQPAPVQPAVQNDERKFCFNCGARLNPGAKFCSSCGTKQP